MTKRGGRKLTEEIAELGGEMGVRKVAERALREGGDDALSALVRLTRLHGSDALRAADNFVSVPRLVKAIDELPGDMAGQALRRLAVETDGRVLAEAVERCGASVLRAEVRHPGIGGRLVSVLGDDGAAIASWASRDQAIAIARHADDIAKLPKSQRTGILKLLHSDGERMVAFMGRFAETNPGKTLFIAATTAVILGNSDRIFGGGTIVIGPDGKPVSVPKPGLLEQILQILVQPMLQSLLRYVLPLVALAAAIWLGMKLWFAYRLSKLRHDVAAARLRHAGSDEKKEDQAAP